MFKEWFKKEMKAIDLDKPVEKAETIHIEYSGEHSFSVPHHSYNYNSSTHRYEYSAYISGDGNVKFTLNGIDYDFVIRVFTHLGDFESMKSAYIGVCEMSQKDIVEKMKEDIAYRIKRDLEHMGEEEARKMMEDRKINLNISFEVNKKNLM